MKTIKEVLFGEDCEIWDISTGKDNQIEIVYLDHSVAYDDGEIRCLRITKEDYDEILASCDDS
jgi:hypothetical protein